MKRKEPFDIPTLDESLRRDLKSGKMTLKEAARELAIANWTPYIVTESEAARILRLDKESTL